jgi:hypothetical protein
MNILASTSPASQHRARPAHRQFWSSAVGPLLLSSGRGCVAGPLTRASRRVNPVRQRSRWRSERRSSAPSSTSRSWERISEPSGRACSALSVSTNVGAALAIDAPCTQCLRHGDPMHVHT